jgi:hypothetical protein
MQILAPTVVAAVVSGAALLARELIAGRTSAGRARARDEGRRLQLLLEQTRLLWDENARLRRRERECEGRYRALAQRFGNLERRCRDLRRRLDCLGRHGAGGRRAGRRSGRMRPR